MCVCVPMWTVWHDKMQILKQLNIPVFVTYYRLNELRVPCGRDKLFCSIGLINNIYFFVLQIKNVNSNIEPKYTR